MSLRTIIYLAQVVGQRHDIFSGHLRLVVHGLVECS